jgi:hypothetical protein
MFGHVEIISCELFEMRTSKNMRGHQYKLYKKYDSSSLRAAFLTERIVYHWNNLRHCDFSSSNAFKRIMKLVDFTQSLKYV